MFTVFNEIMSLLFFLLTGIAIMSPKVHDGVVVKIGLICMSLGFLGAFLAGTMEYVGSETLAATQAFIYLGLMICVIGYLWRVRVHQTKGVHRRASDWIDLNNNFEDSHDLRRQ